MLGLCSHLRTLRCKNLVFILLTALHSHLTYQIIMQVYFFQLSTFNNSYLSPLWLDNHNNSFFHLEHRVSLLSRINQKCSQCINMYQKTRAYCTYPFIFATCWLPVGPWLCFWHPMCRRTPWGHKMPLSWWSLNPDKKTKVLKTHFYTEAFLWTSVLLCRTNLVLDLQINEENASVFSIDCSVCFWERNKIALLHFTSVLQCSSANIVICWSQFSKEDIRRWEHLLIKGWYCPKVWWTLESKLSRFHIIL